MPRPNHWNRFIYAAWAPFYDFLVQAPPLLRARERAIEELAPRRLPHHRASEGGRRGRKAPGRLRIITSHLLARSLIDNYKRRRFERDRLQDSFIAVGTAVTGGPPRRSLREELPHTAPASSRARNRSLGYGWIIRGRGRCLRPSRFILSHVQRLFPLWLRRRISWSQ